MERNRRMLRNLLRWMALACDARIVERDGLTALVVPESPDRSVVNSVVYDEAAALVEAIPSLAELYEEAGVRAWTVWVPDGEEAAVRALAAAGHVLDADPASMELELARLEELPRNEDLEVTAYGDLAEVAALNAAAYEMAPGPFDAIKRAPGRGEHVYVGRLGGRPVGSVVALDGEADASIEMVATHPDAQGQGVAATLMTRALRDARERGLTHSVLEGTKRGTPLYTRLGYRTLGRMEMWERRAAPAA